MAAARSTEARSGSSMLDLSAEARATDSPNPEDCNKELRVDSWCWRNGTVVVVLVLVLTVIGKDGTGEGSIPTKAWSV